MPRGRRGGEVLAEALLDLCLSDRIYLTFFLVAHVGFNIGLGFFEVMSNIECVTGGFRDSDSIVQREAGREGTKADDDTPGTVAGNYTVPTAGCI